jgi:hypothetical protein
MVFVRQKGSGAGAASLRSGFALGLGGITESFAALVDREAGSVMSGF